MMIFLAFDIGFIIAEFVIVLRDINEEQLIRQDVISIDMLNTLNNVHIHLQFLYFGIIKKNMESETIEMHAEISKELELKMAS